MRGVLLSAFCPLLPLQHSRLSCQLRPLIPHVSYGIPQLIYCSCLNVTGLWVDNVTMGFLLTKENDNCILLLLPSREENCIRAVVDESPEETTA